MDRPKTLLSPFRLGALELLNRVVMAPMTRCRAEGHVPDERMARYYVQRASAGLIVTEATQVSPLSIGYPQTPGIHSAEQVEGWKQVTRAVHEADGRIFLQLWHVGRIAHPAWIGGEQPVAPSAVAAAGQTWTPEGMQPHATPRALESDEIPDLVEQYRVGAANAKAAGFDGVEIHAANGYLIDQFLRDRTNQRTDRYGGSIENRARFLLEVTEAVVGEWGARQVGVRLSPSGTFNDMGDSDSEATFGWVARALNGHPLAYLHVVEAGEADLRHGGRSVPTRLLRSAFEGVLMVNGAYTGERAEQVLSSGGADLVSFGTAFLANPDLPARLAAGAGLNAPDPETFYAGGEKGYLDYPALTAD
jgi:N-ethylmaleimide reductase